MAEKTDSAAVSLEQLIVLNEEIAALVRAGIPLDKGLCALGDDLPGRLGRVSGALANSLAAGRSLEETLAEHGRQFPPIYLAVVQAGVRAGRLPAALESLADAIARIRDARRAVASALAYPLTVAAIAWGFFVYYVMFVAPRMAAVFESFGPVADALCRTCETLGPTVQYWGPGVPLAVFLLAAGWWWYSGRGSLAQPWWSMLLLGWCPWIGRMLRAVRAATFVDILALMVRSDVPLDEALAPAAEATGDSRTIRAARELAAAIERGEYAGQNPAGARKNVAGLPPLVGWIVTDGAPRRTLLAALEHAGEIYHRRATHYAETARMMVPIVLSLAIGGSVTAVCALIVFGPYVAILKNLSLP